MLPAEGGRCENLGCSVPCAQSCANRSSWSLRVVVCGKLVFSAHNVESQFCLFSFLVLSRPLVISGAEGTLSNQSQKSMVC